MLGSGGIDKLLANFLQQAAILILDFSGFLRRLTSSIGTFQDDKTMVLTF
jgi:hypothetical protein